MMRLSISTRRCSTNICLAAFGTLPRNQITNSLIKSCLSCWLVGRFHLPEFISLRWDLKKLASRASQLYEEINRGMLLPVALSKEKEELKNMVDKYHHVKDNLLKLEKEKDFNSSTIVGLQAEKELINAEVQNRKTEMVKKVVHNFGKDNLEKLEQEKKQHFDEIVRLQTCNGCIDAAALQFNVTKLESLVAKYGANVDNAAQMSWLEWSWNGRIE